ncbi:MAG: bifunctional UDP-sugar hydrolase/5'-nucleotidase [Ignavibacteria bacterium]|nr:bifunctional UDP-sugar hydrolase/5'-nucleotidase [Ignavibacteria bacterium]
MSKCTYLVALLMAVVCSACSFFVFQQNENIGQLTILHWNDFHAQNIPYDVTVSDSATGIEQTYKVGGTANLLSYMNHHRRGKSHVAVLNAGDDFQGTPISSISRGRSQIDLLNIIAPDAMVLGNHEFDYGLENLKENIKVATYPILAANLYDSTAGMTFAPPYVVKQCGGVKIGIIGLLPPDLSILTLTENLAGTTMLNIDSVVTIYANQLKNQYEVDLVVILSHMGFDQDTSLAMRRGDIDVIVGGHSHTPLFKPFKKNRTIICQSGSRGRYLGKLDLTVDLMGDSVLTHTGELIETKLGVYPIDSVTETKVLAFEKLVDEELSEVIGTLAVDWKRSSISESNIGNWEADVMREFAGTDIALMNSGGLRKDLRAGPITRRDIWEINPFGNTFVTFSISGDTLLRMLEWQAARRGEFMQVSGLGYSFDPSQPSGKMVVEARVNGAAIEPSKMYSIVTNNYVADHIRELLGIRDEFITSVSTNAIDRDVFIHHIEQHKTISSRIEGRVIQIENTNNR